MSHALLPKATILNYHLNDVFVEQDKYGASSCALAAVFNILLCFGFNEEELEQKLDTGVCKEAFIQQLSTSNDIFYDEEQGLHAIRKRLCRCLFGKVDALTKIADDEATFNNCGDKCSISVYKYCLSLVLSGTMSWNNIKMASLLSNNEIIGRIVPFYPCPFDYNCLADESIEVTQRMKDDFHLGKWLDQWMSDGALAITSTKYQFAGGSWHAQMIVEVSEDKQYITVLNPTEKKTSRQLLKALRYPPAMPIPAIDLFSHFCCTCYSSPDTTNELCELCIEKITTYNWPTLFKSFKVPQQIQTSLRKGRNNATGYASQKIILPQVSGPGMVRLYANVNSIAGQKLLQLPEFDEKSMELLIGQMDCKDIVAKC